MRNVTHNKQIRWGRKEFCYCSPSQFLKLLSRSLAKVIHWSLTKCLSNLLSADNSFRSVLLQLCGKNWKLADLQKD